MKTFVLASSVAVLFAGYCMWGSKPARYITKNNQQYSVPGTYVRDTVPTRDTTPHKDTMRRKDTLP
jgi:hypothetical protein